MAFNIKSCCQDCPSTRPPCCIHNTTSVLFAVAMTTYLTPALRLCRYRMTRFLRSQKVQDIVKCWYQSHHCTSLLLEPSPVRRRFPGKGNDYVEKPVTLLDSVPRYQRCAQESGEFGHLHGNQGENEWGYTVLSANPQTLLLPGRQDEKLYTKRQSWMQRSLCHWLSWEPKQITNSVPWESGSWRGWRTEWGSLKGCAGWKIFNTSFLRGGRELLFVVPSNFCGVITCIMVDFKLLTWYLKSTEYRGAWVAQ